MRDLREIHIKAFMAIGPARIAVLTLLLTASQDEAADTDSDEMSLALERLKTARNMFDTELGEMLSACEMDLSQNTRDAKAAARSSLDQFFGFVGMRPSQVIKDLRGMGELRDVCMRDIEPKATAFLQLLTAELIEEDKKRRNGERDRVRKALRDVEGVGRSIQLISFNAGVEAARLGEQGQGFTVIASEIRNLANTTNALIEEISEVLDA